MFTGEQAQQAYDQLDSLDVNEAQVQATLSAATTASPQSKACQVYQTVRPFLLILVTLFFIPTKWQNAIRVLTQTWDLLCSQQQQFPDIASLNNPAAAGQVSGSNVAGANVAGATGTQTGSTASTTNPPPPNT